MKQANRRDFLKAAAASAVAVPYLVPGWALGADGHAAPSNRIVMGGIGIGNQGSGDQQAYVNRNDVQYVAACNVNEQHLRAARAGRTSATATAIASRTTISATCSPAPISTPFTWPRPTTGTSRSSSRPAGTAKTFIARNRRPARCVKVRWWWRRRGATAASFPAAASACWKITARRSIPAGAANWGRSSRSTSTSARCRSLLPARRTGSRRLRLGHVARPRALGAVPSVPLQR